MVHTMEYNKIRYKNQYIIPLEQMEIDPGYVAVVLERFQAMGITLELS